MSFSPRMAGGHPMSPGIGRVLRGQDGDRQVNLRSGLVGRVWRSFARPYRKRLLLLIALIAVASALTVVPARLIGLIVDSLSDTTADGAALAVDAARSRITWLSQ